MRIILAAAAALAVLTVSGCDINTAPSKPAKVTCNCASPPPAAVPPSSDTPVPPPEHHYRHHYGYGHGGYRMPHGYRWRREYAELSVEIGRASCRERV